MDNFNIVYTLNNQEQSFNLTVVSICSLFETNLHNQINLFIIYDENFNINLLEHINAFKRYPNCNNINFIQINSKRYLNLKSKINVPESLYIFDAIEKINCDRLLYINSLTFINGDLTELYKTNIDNYEIAATEYLYSDDIPLYDKEFAFNFSLMLINTKNFKKNISYEALDFSKIQNTLAIYIKSSTVCFFNLIISNWKNLNYKYNYTQIWRNKEILTTLSPTSKSVYKKINLHIETPIGITLYGPTPLGNEICRNNYLAKWWEYAEKSPNFNNIKKHKIYNQYKLSSTSSENSFKYNLLLSKIYPYIKPYWFRILLGFLIAIPLGLLDGVTAFALKPYMDYVIGNKALEISFLNLNFSITSFQMAFIIPLGVIIFAIIQGILRYLNGYFSTWTSQRITNDVKFDLFDRLINMHPQFFDDNSSGIIISRYMADPGMASAGIVENLKTITTSFCGALGLIAVMIYSSWKLAFVGILILLIAFVPVILIRKRIKEASNKNMIIGGNITTNVNETYSGNKIMAAYCLQERQSKIFKEQINKSFNINMSLYKRAGWMSPIMYIIASCGIACVLGFGTYLINANQMSAGAFASFVTSLLLLYKPVKTLGNTLTGIQNIFVAMSRIFELFDLESALIECKNPIEMKDLNKSISFENINFEYIPSKTILKNFNLKVKKNETIAIVGNSGGGKSTLVNLIPRFYDVKNGNIKIDDINIKNFSLKSLRKNISIVFQDNFLYSGTIKENILMGKPDATKEELINAINYAHLQDVIKELPDGIETMLGERGLTLSGGQRQRVAIARAILKDAPIVILDEATSALDNESEAIVQKAMDNLVKNKTVFIIAHRLSTIKNADRIIVINDGILVEEGSHDSLINIENGYYKTLFEMQFKVQEKL